MYHVCITSSREKPRLSFISKKLSISFLLGQKGFPQKNTPEEKANYNNVFPLNSLQRKLVRRVENVVHINIML
jgi:hypothetical protein